MKSRYNRRAHEYVVFRAVHMHRRLCHQLPHYFYWVFTLRAAAHAADQLHSVGAVAFIAYIVAVLTGGVSLKYPVAQLAFYRFRRIKILKLGSANNAVVFVVHFTSCFLNGVCALNLLQHHYKRPRGYERGPHRAFPCESLMQEHKRKYQRYDYAQLVYRHYLAHLAYLYGFIIA